MSIVAIWNLEKEEPLHICLDPRQILVIRDLMTNSWLNLDQIVTLCLTSGVLQKLLLRLLSLSKCKPQAK